MMRWEIQGTVKQRIRNHQDIKRSEDRIRKFAITTYQFAILR